MKAGWYNRCALWWCILPLLWTIQTTGWSISSSSRLQTGRMRLVAPHNHHSTESPGDANDVSSTSIPTIQYVPSLLEFQNVSHSNPPPALVQQLFTFTRSRTWALDQVTLSLSTDRPLVLLTGQSASGKSTLLRLIEQKESPTQGTVVVASGSDISFSSAKPILLDVDLSPFGHDGLRYESRKTLQIILQIDLQEMRNQQGQRSATMASTVFQRVLEDLLAAADLLACTTKTPSQLSPSEWHMFVIVRAALFSMLAHSTSGTMVPGPILCIDEAWDRETPVVLQATYLRLQRLLSQTGGIGIIATHVPERFPSGAQRWTLCRGALLRSHLE